MKVHLKDQGIHYALRSSKCCVWASGWRKQGENTLFTEPLHLRNFALIPSVFCWTGGGGSKQKEPWLKTCKQHVLSSRTSNLLLQLDTWLNPNSFACLRLFISSLTSHKGKLLLHVVAVPVHCISLTPDAHERLCFCKFKFRVSQHFWSHGPPKRTSQ